MALVLKDRVQVSATANTTVSFTCGSATTGFQAFSVIGNANTTYYTATDGPGNWESGIGTYTTAGTLLTRTTVLASSNAGSAVTFSGTVNLFVNYPATKSINLDASGNASPLGTVASGTWQGSTVGVAYGGTGVTASSGANSVVLRDADQNAAINRINQSNTVTTSAAGTTILTAASSYSQTLVGTAVQTYQMPDATTLATGVAFEFNNNSTSLLTIQDYALATIATISAGGAAALVVLTNVTVAGTWDTHGYIPENVTWGTNALVLGGTVITGGTWQGGTITSAYGGTGLTTFTAANNALYSTSASVLAAGTLPVLAGGTGSTTNAGTAYALKGANSDITSITGLTTALSVAQGGTNSTGTPTAGGAGYGTGTAHAYTAAGTANQILISNAASAPTWATLGGLGLSEFAATTALVFYQQTAPTGWTKSTTDNDKALRVVSGTSGGTAGGSVAFSTAFASQTPAGTVAVGVSAGTLAVSAGTLAGTIGTLAGTVGTLAGTVGTLANAAFTLATTDIPSHTHPFNTGSSISPNTGAGRANTANGATGTTNAAGGGGSHTHTQTGAPGISGSPTLSGSPTITSATFTGTAINLAVQYCDIIMCTKN